MEVVDAHVHVWALGALGHEWPTVETPALYRDFTMAELQSEAPALAGAVLVQSQPTDGHTDWLLQVADTTPLAQAVVGWVDLMHDDAPARITELAAKPKLRGLRPMLQAIDDTDWLLRDNLAPAIEAMIANRLRLDALIQPRHLGMLTRFVDRWPALPVVIDHAAKPDVTNSPDDNWQQGIAQLAARGVYCKLSGMRTEQGQSRPAEDLAPYIRHVTDCFAERLMWGSDWPVLHLSGDRHSDWLAAATRITGATGAARECLFAGAACRFYDIATSEVDR